MNQDNNVLNAENTSSATNVTVSVNHNLMVCPRCGESMRKDARYCMKCGQLNYAHPENENMKKYAWQSIKSGHFVSGANVDTQQLTIDNIRSVSELNPFKTCFITNILLHLVLGVLVYVVLLVLLNQNVPVGGTIAIVIGTILLFILNYSTQAVYLKAGEPWWSYFVPLYNNYIFFRVALGNGWIFLFMLLPVVNLVIGAVALYNLGKKFYKSGWLTLFFPFVMIPIIAFDKNTEYSMLAMMTTVHASNMTVDVKTKTNSEKEYGRKKFIMNTLVIVVVGGAIYLGWPYLSPILKKLYEFFMQQLEFFKQFF